MRKRNLLKLIITLLLTASVLFTAFPATAAAALAKHKNHHDFPHPHNKQEDKDLKKPKPELKYLVLIGQANGTYTALTNIASASSDHTVMVKLKPLCTALGLSYEDNWGGWKSKGCIISLGQSKNVYLKDKKYYYHYDCSSTYKKYNTKKYHTKSKQLIFQNEYMADCSSLSTLVSYQYYDTFGINAYSSLGYAGVIVYNRYSAITKLPDISTVTNLSSQSNNSSNNNIAIKPVTSSDSSYNSIKYIEANYSTLQSNNNVLLDLSEVLNAFSSYGLPFDGIYGYGNCDTAITLTGVNKNGYSVGSLKTTGGEFSVNLPGAVKLIISGEQKNLMIDFMPVKPIVITDTARIPMNQISWLYPSDRYARQYFVVSEYKRFYPENITSPYSLSRRLLDVSCKDKPDYANAYQRITAVFLSPYTEMTSPNCYINVQKTNNMINNSLVSFSNPGYAVLAADYEKKVIAMISSLNSNGTKIYYPADNFKRQLIMKLPDNSANTAYSYITVDTSWLNLDNFMDYYNHLHEMTHFYEAAKPHYGFRFAAWADGNAANLAKRAMDTLGVNHKDPQGVDYFDSMFATNYNFLTQSDRNNFEACYLNASGWNATIIGYHFTNFLQDMYGSDVIYRILEKVYAAGIPTGPGRNSTYDKQFTDCIKAVTSQNVFQLFVEYCVK